MKKLNFDDIIFGRQIFDERKEYDLSILKFVGNVADSLRYQCFVVGGYVRDCLLQKPNKDIDIVVVGSGTKMANAVANALGREYCSVNLYENYGTAQVHYRKDDVDIELEFVGARHEFYHRESRNPIVEDGTLYDDISRRDFTINNMAICLNTSHYGKLVDMFDGETALQEHLIKTPLDPDITFSDDPLRMLRAIRFASRFGFKIDDATFESIKKNHKRLNIIVRERIIEEFNKILVSPVPSYGISLLKNTGLLQMIFPELVALSVRDEHDGIGHKDVFEHTLKVVDNVRKETDDLWTLYGALFHDIGKPKSKQWSDVENNWTFNNHEFYGEKMIPNIFSRVNLPLDKRMDKVKTLIRLHMRPQQITDNEGVTDSAVRRLMFEAGDYLDDLMILAKADITTANIRKRDHFVEMYTELENRMNAIRQKDYITLFQPCIDGNEIMEMFNLKPCKTVGILKQALKDAVIDAKIENTHDACEVFLREKYQEIQGEN